MDCDGQTKLLPRVTGRSPLGCQDCPFLPQVQEQISLSERQEAGQSRWAVTRSSHCVLSLFTADEGEELHHLTSPALSQGLHVGALAACVERGPTNPGVLGKYVGTAYNCVKENVHDALSRCGQDLGGNWPETETMLCMAMPCMHSCQLVEIPLGFHNCSSSIVVSCKTLAVDNKSRSHIDSMSWKLRHGSRRRCSNVWGILDCLTLVHVPAAADYYSSRGK